MPAISYEEFVLEHYYQYQTAIKSPQLRGLRIKTLFLVARPS
jgi:hypothetical protein